MFPIGTRVYYDEINGSYTYGLLPGLYVTSIVADTLFLSGNVATTLNNIELLVHLLKQRICHKIILIKQVLLHIEMLDIEVVI